MHVIFIRHGESTGNAGQPADDLARIELTPTGHAQARRVAAEWSQAPTLIALSPYLRTHLTAQPTRERFAQVPVQVLPMEEFTYLEPSRWRGTTREQRLPHIEAYWQRADPEHQDGPGAESYNTLLQRVQQTLAQLQQLPPDALVYAFSHGQFMQALRVSLLYPHWTAQQQMAHFWPFNARHPVVNGERMGVRWVQGRWQVDAVQEPSSQQVRLQGAGAAHAQR